MEDRESKPGVLLIFFYFSGIVSKMFCTAEVVKVLRRCIIPDVGLQSLGEVEGGGWVVKYFSRLYCQWGPLHDPCPVS